MRSAQLGSRGPRSQSRAAQWVASAPTGSTMGWDGPGRRTPLRDPGSVIERSADRTEGGREPPPGWMDAAPAASPRARSDGRGQVWAKPKSSVRPPSRSEGAVREVGVAGSRWVIKCGCSTRPAASVCASIRSLLRGVCREGAGPQE
ncbi:unnamed protein product [Rangifer tarandus platyrhynchus]|uniref:Uncharacterized protein n=2 Tax=Rangifer tarandus platyrhynchus TaxID=3082113 RepID=A0ABN8ZAU0_RANTA|nr:unnamed protein product [Rangifer tarandus platyrhynchus]CAI9704017.1 unnamed protein product [Rangifer tarandus platyrhynchus]